MQRIFLTNLVLLMSFRAIWQKLQQFSVGYNTGLGQLSAVSVQRSAFWCWDCSLYSCRHRAEDIGIKGGVGAMPPARGSTPAPRPHQNGYGYTFEHRCKSLLETKRLLKNNCSGLDERSAISSLQAPV